MEIDIVDANDGNQGFVSNFQERIIVQETHLVKSENVMKNKFTSLLIDPTYANLTANTNNTTSNKCSQKCKYKTTAAKQHRVQQNIQLEVRRSNWLASSS
jgi:hypothetical protein